MKKIFSMTIMIGLGFLMGRTRMVKEDDTRALSLISLYYCAPCSLLTALHMEYSPERTRNLIFCMLIALAFHIVFIILTRLFFRGDKLCVSQKASLIYTNAGNLLLPIIGSVLGQEALFYCCAYMVVSNILVWSHEYSMLSGVPRIQWKKLFTNSTVIAIVIGLILFYTQIELPMPIRDAITGMNAMIGPISMLIAGIIMGYMNLKEAFTNKGAYIVCLYRLIVYPVIIVLLMKLAGAAHWFPGAAAVFMVPFLGACGPTASGTVQLSRIFNVGFEEASVANMLSLLLCVITMPVMIYLYQLLLF